MGDTEKKSRPEDWKKLFKGIRMGIIVVEREELKITKFNSSAEEIFNRKLETETPISDVSHELIDEELIADIEQMFEDLRPVKELVLTKESECFAVIVESWKSCKSEEAIISFIDVTNLKVELEEKIQAEKQLQREILNVEKKERWRLGKFLHDTAAQNLLSIKMVLDRIDPKIQQLDKETRMELKKIKRVVVKTEKSLRELSRSVLPVEDEGNILDAFQKLVEKTEDIYGVGCVFKSGNDIEKIEDVPSASLYYISQEAIQNAIHHGQADKIEVSLSCDEKILVLTIKDNGIGYDESAEGDGMGINIMRHRAELLRGTLEVKKMPDSSGTRVTCRIPLQN